MDWDEIQSEFDRAYGMSCKPSGLQKYKAGHIFDENMSVKWNRNKLEEENKKFKDEVSRLNTAKNKALLAVHELVYQKIQDDVGHKNVIAIATADDLAPLQGEFASSAYMAFYLRTSSQGEKYIVVKDGFSVRAAIMQPDVKEALRDSLLEAMTLLRMEGLKDGTVDITRQCWPTGSNEETEADDEET